MIHMHDCGCLMLCTTGCNADVDCDANCNGHKCTCEGKEVHCNSTGFCTNGLQHGELCNISAGIPHSSSGPKSPGEQLSPGPACAGPNDGLLEVHMAAGRDGSQFKRVSRLAFVPRGNGHPRPGFPGIYSGDFDAASTAVAVGTIDSGDETLMYEIGWQYTHGGYDGFAEPPEIPGGPVQSGISLLRLRRHGFVSYRAADGQGQLVTKPLLLPGCNETASFLALVINVQTSVDGSVNISLVSEARVLATSLPIVGNNVATRVQWAIATTSGNATYPGRLPANVQHVPALQLQADMAYSDLYGFQFTCVTG